MKEKKTTKIVILLLALVLCAPNFVKAYETGGNANSAHNGNVGTVPSGRSAWYSGTWGMRLTLVGEDGVQLEDTKTVDVVNKTTNIKKSSYYYNKNANYKWEYVRTDNVSKTTPTFSKIAKNSTPSTVFTAKSKGLKTLPDFLNTTNSKIVYNYFTSFSKTQWMNFAEMMGLTLDEFYRYIYEGNKGQKVYLIVEPLYYYSYYENGAFRKYFTTSTEMAYVVKNTKGRNAYLYSLLYGIAPFSIYLSQNENRYTRVSVPSTGYLSKPKSNLKSTKGYGIGVFWIRDIVKNPPPTPPTPSNYYCTYQNGKYYGATGKVVSKETFEAECPAQLICQVVNNTYYGIDGRKVDASTYKKECLPPTEGQTCTVRQDTLGASNGKECVSNLLVDDVDWSCATKSDELSDNNYCSISYKESSILNLPTISKEQKMPSTYLDFGEVSVSNKLDYKVDIDLDTWKKDHDYYNAEVLDTYKAYYNSVEQNDQCVNHSYDGQGKKIGTKCTNEKVTTYSCSSSVAASVRSLTNKRLTYKKSGKNCYLYDGNTRVTTKTVANSRTFARKYCSDIVSQGQSTSQRKMCENLYSTYVKRTQKATKKTTTVKKCKPVYDTATYYDWTDYDGKTYKKQALVDGACPAVSEEAKTNYEHAITTLNAIDDALKSCMSAQVTYQNKAQPSISYKDPSGKYTYTGELVKNDEESQEVISKNFTDNQTCVVDGKQSNLCTITTINKNVCAADGKTKCKTENIRNTFSSTLYTSAEATFTSDLVYELNANSVWSNVLKPEGTFVSNELLNDKYSKYKETNNYINLGMPVLPIGSKSKSGVYDDNLWLTISNIGSSNKEYKCYYKFTVGSGGKDTSGSTCTVGMPGYPNCPEDTSGQIVIYRPIDLTDPFPGYDASTRVPGYNWRSEWVHNLNDDDYNALYGKYSNSSSTYLDVEKYIHDNRGVKEYELYNKEPMYSITLTPSLMLDIRNYNKERMSKDKGYADFNMQCSSNGRECLSNFIRNSNFSQHFSGCGTGNWDACDTSDGIVRGD